MIKFLGMFGPLAALSGNTPTNESPLILHLVPPPSSRSATCSLPHRSCSLARQYQSFTLADCARPCAPPHPAWDASGVLQSLKERRVKESLFDRTSAQTNSYQEYLSDLPSKCLISSHELSLHLQSDTSPVYFSNYKLIFVLF